MMLVIALSVLATGSTVAFLFFFLKTRKLQELALLDPLTGLLNRRGFRSLVDPMVNEVKAVMKGLQPRKSQLTTFAVASFDLDHFKEINDNHGHAAGDDIIKTFAGIARGHARGRDLVARWGGEEFIVLFADATTEEAGIVAERIRASVEERVIDRKGKKISFTVSIGVAEFDPKHDLSDALNRADTELYRAKKGGRNRVEVQLPAPHMEQAAPVARRAIHPV